MILSLPVLVILAALTYFVASRAGWLDSIARWRGRPPSPRGRRPGTPLPTAPSESSDATPRRLEVFEEFLRSLNRDDSQDS